MGRNKSTLNTSPRGSHFTWDERLKLQYLYCGTNGYKKERRPCILAKIFSKSPKTITRELKRGMVLHIMSYIPFERVEYNADHAQLDADKKSIGKGPAPKSGRHFELVNRMSELILKERYSP